MEVHQSNTTRNPWRRPLLGGIGVLALSLSLVATFIFTQQYYQSTKQQLEQKNAKAAAEVSTDSTVSTVISIPCANLDPSICNETPQIQDILVDPNGLANISAKMDTEWEQYGDYQRSRWLTGYVVARYLQSSDTIKNNTVFTQLVANMVIAFRSIDTKTYDYLAEGSQLKDNQYGFFLHTAGIIKNLKNLSDTDFFTQLNQNTLYTMYMGDLNYIYNDTIAVSQTQYDELYNYLNTFSNTSNPTLSAQVPVFVDLLTFDPLDIPVTVKLKYRILEYIKSLTVSQATSSGCDFFNTVISNKSILLRWARMDSSPANIPIYTNAIQQLNLTCVNNEYSTWLTKLTNAWGEYRALITNNPSLFTPTPDRQAILTHYGIAASQTDGYTTYGSQQYPLNSIDQFNAINALEIKQLIGSYFFPPGKGYQITRQYLTQNSSIFDYAVYASSTAAPWVPNMTDYASEQVGRGNYIQYQIAHEKAMSQLLYPSIYSLPVPQFKNRVFFVTTPEYLRTRNQYLQSAGLITAFSGYLVPDTSTQNAHAWKVQSIGPNIPGAMGVLSAEDNWRGSCGTVVNQYEKYQFPYGGITYCLDRGGMHERGHVATGMVDLYWSNSVDFFFNPLTLDRCNLFSALRTKSPRLLATSISDSTLSINSDPKRWTVFDWEYVFNKNFVPKITDSRYSNMYNYLVVKVNSSVPSKQIERIELYSNNQAFTTVQIPIEVTTNSATNVIDGFKIKSDSFYKFRETMNYVYVYYTDGSSDSIVLADYIIDNAYLQMQRLGQNTVDPTINLTFLSDHGTTATTPILCSTPEERSATAAYYYHNKIAIYSGITTRTAEIKQDTQNYAMITLPQDLTYVFRLNPQNSPAYTFPETWTGPMPTTYVTPTSVVTPTIAATATPTQIVTPTAVLSPTPTSSVPTPTRTPTPLPTSTPVPPTPTRTPTPMPPTATPTGFVPTATPTTLLTSHVGDLDGTKQLQGSQNWKAKVTIRVDTQFHVPLSGVTVRGQWTGVSGTTSCVTTSTGTCSMTSSNTKNPSVTFTITSLSHPSYPYKASENHDPDGDSTGTTIVVRK